MLVTYEGHSPVVHPTARIAENATLAGAVKVDAEANIWYGAVVRGDEAPVSVGRETNVQDNAVIHASMGYPAAIGSRVTVGHGAIVHGCTVEDGCLVGMGSILLDGCVIGAHSLIGAGALVTQHKVIPPNSLVMGSPARVIRSLTEAEIAALEVSVDDYLHLSGQLPLAGG
ncbi:MAG TPA: gamma carbonic anhydrase family protein [Candidatus Galloscillospira excrementavium]|nr:gamma carbonic anhydrase family protein [Candidatus Galloscillospira excrementavium]